MKEDETSLATKKQYPWFCIALIFGGLVLVVAGNVLSTYYPPLSSPVVVTRSGGYLLAISGLVIFLLKNLIARFAAKPKEWVSPFREPTLSKSHAQELTEGVLHSLRQTRPFVMILGFLSIIVGSLMILGGITAGAMIVFNSTKPGSVPASTGRFMIIAYVVIGLLYILPGLLLIRYADRIKRMLVSPSLSTLEEALKSQQTFWKFICIAALLIVGLYFVAAVGFMVIQAAMPI